jgi:hypothetical protein
MQPQAVQDAAAAVECCAVASTERRQGLSGVHHGLDRASDYQHEDADREVDHMLTDKQRIFCRRYVACGQGKQAAVYAGYSGNGAKQAGSRLLRHREIRQEIERLQAAIAKTGKSDHGQGDPRRRGPSAETRATAAGRPRA